MELAERLVDGLQLTGGGSGVTLTYRDGGHYAHCRDVLASQTDFVFENQDNHYLSTSDSDDPSRRRPDSVWLDCLYSWNPLATGTICLNNKQVNTVMQ